MDITELARDRYELHEERGIGCYGPRRSRQGAEPAADGLVGSGFCRSCGRELKKVFKRDIPLKERDEWEEWLAARKAEHRERHGGDRAA